MKTTEMYFEYVIIGLETLLWIFMLFFTVLGVQMLELIHYCIKNLFVTVVLLCACYVLGLITDRVADKIFENTKNSIKGKYVINATTSISVWEQHKECPYANFTLSRIRVLRSSIMNCVVICVLGMYISSTTYHNNQLAIIILVLGIFFSISAYIGHVNLLENYYQKTNALENDNKK